MMENFDGGEINQNDWEFYEDYQLNKEDMDLLLIGRIEIK